MYSKRKSSTHNELGSPVLDLPIENHYKGKLPNLSVITPWNWPALRQILSILKTTVPWTLLFISSSVKKIISTDCLLSTQDI